MTFLRHHAHKSLLWIFGLLVIFQIFSGVLFVNATYAMDESTFINCGETPEHCGFMWDGFWAATPWLIPGHGINREAPILHAVHEVSPGVFEETDEALVPIELSQGYITYGFGAVGGGGEVSGAYVVRIPIDNLRDEGDVFILADADSLEEVTRTTLAETGGRTTFVQAMRRHTGGHEHFFDYVDELGVGDDDGDVGGEGDGGGEEGGGPSGGGEDLLRVDIILTGISKVRGTRNAIFGPYQVEFYKDGYDPEDEDQPGPSATVKSNESRPGDRKYDGVVLADSSVNLQARLNLANTSVTSKSVVCLARPDLPTYETGNCTPLAPISSRLLEIVLPAVESPDLVPFDGAGSAPCSGLSLGIFLCLAIDSLHAGVSWGYDVLINSLLFIQPIQDVDENGNTTALYAVWSSVRVVSNILLIGVFAIAAFGISLSWFMTPYELKQLLPRMAIGAIAAQISWYIVGFTVDIFNLLGAGIHGLILRPVADTGGSTWSLSASGVVIDALLGAGGVAIFKSFGAAKGLLMTIFPILILALIAVLFVMIILILRQALVVLLLIASPIVFVLWALPATNSLLKQWWGLFWKLLLMYPMITALIGFGELTSKVVVAGREGELLFQIVAIVALFAPFFLITKTFSFAGGVVANITAGYGQQRKKISERLFGSDDPYNRNKGHRGKTKDYREQYRQQHRFKNAQRNNQYIRRLRSAAGLSIQGLTFGNYKSLLRNPIRNRRAFGSLGKYAAMHIAPRNLLDTANRAHKSAAYRTNLQTVDQRMSTRVIEAKKRIGQWLSSGDDEAIFALFGDYNWLTGQRLSNAAILQAKEHRSDQAMTNAGYKYYASQAVSLQDWQSLRNNFAVWNPHREGSLEHAVFASMKTGMDKGMSFGNQNQRKDAKNRAWSADKHDSYHAVTANREWIDKYYKRRSEEMIDDPEPYTMKTAISEIRSEIEQKESDASYTSPLLESRQDYIEEYMEKHNNSNDPLRRDKGLIRDGRIVNAINENMDDMKDIDITSQWSSNFEMYNEVAVRVHEVDRNFDALLELDSRLLEHEEQLRMDSKMLKNEYSKIRDKGLHDARSELEDLLNTGASDADIAKAEKKYKKVRRKSLRLGRIVERVIPPEGSVTNHRIDTVMKQARAEYRKEYENLDRDDAMYLDKNVTSIELENHRGRFRKPSMEIAEQLSTADGIQKLVDEGIISSSDAGRFRVKLTTTPEKFTDLEYLNLDIADKKKVREVQVRRWKVEADDAIQQARELAIDLMANAGAIRPDEDQADIQDMQFGGDNPYDTKWRLDELHEDSDYEIAALSASIDDPDTAPAATRRVLEEYHESKSQYDEDQKAAYEGYADSQAMRNNDPKTIFNMDQLDKRLVEIDTQREQAFEPINNRAKRITGSWTPEERQKNNERLHLERVDEVFDKAKPDMPRAVWRELNRFALGAAFVINDDAYNEYNLGFDIEHDTRRR